MPGVGVESRRVWGLVLESALFLKGARDASRKLGEALKSREDVGSQQAHGCARIERVRGELVLLWLNFIH